MIYYNTSNLVHEDSTVNNAFTSIDTSASLASLTTDNTWGYSTSLDNGTTWSTYSGLPSTTTKPLLDISDPAAPSTIDFKIAAKSSTTQASGTYNNIITFYAVGKPKPPDYMQDTATIKAELQNVGDEMQVMDARDGNIYWIAKQADGNIWMTQNLDLCIGCEGTTTLTSQNTDLNESGSGAYVEGYTNADGLIVWSPAYTSVTSRTTFISNDQIRPALPYSSDGGDVNPYSVEGGDVYIYPENTGTSTIYNSMDKCTTAGHTSENCLHFHRGNYYNWSAAIASNDSADLATQYSVAGNSICPSGWRLPKARSASTQTATTNEFGQLFYASGVTSSLTATSYASSKMLLFDSPLYFTRSSSVSADFWSNRGSYGDYLSSTVLDSSRIYYLSFSGSNINSAFGVYARASGNTVRCLVK